MSKTFTVNIQVIQVYELEVEARDKRAAADKAYAMTSEQVREEGKLVNVETDHVSVMD